MPKLYYPMCNDGIELSDTPFTTLTDAKDALKEAYIGDWNEADEDPVGFYDYYIEVHFSTRECDEILSETHYKPYFNKAGGVSLRKLSHEDFSNASLKSKVIHIKM